MTLSDLDTRYHDMLRKLRRWGITESDGITEGRERYAEQPSKALGCRTCETSRAPTTEAVAGIKPGPSELIVSDTTEQKKAA